MKRKYGSLLVICDDPNLASTIIHLQPEMDVRVWLPHKSGTLQSVLREACDEDLSVFIKGDVTKQSFYRDLKTENFVCVIISLKDTLVYRSAREHILDEWPLARILSLHIDDPEDLPRTLSRNERELVLSWAELLDSPVSAELRHIESVHRVNKIRSVLDEGDKIALLLQPDPDPDGLASALALRALLGRNKLSTPIVSFGRVTRPENIAMMKLLDIEVLTISPTELADFDRVALLDTQPGHFSEPLARVDAIIDHHPIATGNSYPEVPYCDIRSQYGATATILTEYMRAGAVNIGQRLATALVYGIKADTLLLNRGVIEADLYAFVTLYQDINYNLLRRIEKPEIPIKFAPTLAQALTTFEVKDGVLVTCLGKVTREDLIPQIADFLLQFEGVEWVVCVGVFDDNIVMSVRNVGYVKNAGDVVKKIINGWGQGGGHRTMAKAIFNKNMWKKKFGSIDTDSIKSKTLQLFVENIG